MTDTDAVCQLKLGWAEGDITPSQPVLIAGQFHARVSEGVLDPITSTALAIDAGGDQAVFVSCDLVAISDVLRDAVRARLERCAVGLDPMKVVLHGTHTHTAPENRLPEVGAGHTSGGTGVDLPAMPIEDYVDFAADRIADTVGKAWDSRSAAGITFGQGFAVVGRNRRWTDMAGASAMYGNTDTPDFSHIEGYEDHSINLLATYDAKGALTGLVVNVPCPSQVSESAFSLSADYWHETRQDLRQRLGDNLFILAQCSAAGDQSPHLLFEKRAAARMLELSGRTERQEIAHRIANAVEETLPYLRGTADTSPVLKHHIEVLDLPLAQLTEADADTATKEAESLRAQYEDELQKLESSPELRGDARWYCTVTAAYRRMRWFEGVVQRFQQQKTHPTRATEVHVIRLGDVAFATNPFEYYLDYGIHIKARSKALQTFLVQLAGQGTYVPSRRSVAGGGYGSIPASNPVDCEGGWQLAARTVEVIEQLWDTVA